MLDAYTVLETMCSCKRRTSFGLSLLSDYAPRTDRQITWSLIEVFCNCTPTGMLIAW